MSRPNHKPRRRASTILVLALIAAPCAADQMSSFLEVEVLGRGYQPEKFYEIGEIDDVNTFNGNLIVTVPVGPTYTTDGGFDYQLALVYNSSAWDFETVLSPLPGSSQPCGRSLVQHAYPQQDANAGMGWRLSLGELYAPRPAPVIGEPDRLEQRYPNKAYDGFLFIGPDGRKVFLREGDPIHPHAPPEQGVSHSTDGTFVRFRNLGVTATVETPDGRTYTFFLYDPDAYDGAGAWRLLSVTDVHGNGVFLSYPSDDLWVLTDSNGRSHRIEWSQADAGAPDEDHLYERVISAVELAGHGGSVLRYELDYQQGRLGMPYGHDAPDPTDPQNTGWPEYEYYGDGYPDASLPFPDKDYPLVPLLQEVALVSPAGTGLEWSFTYYTRLPPGAPARVDEGQLASATLPTGATVSWEYGDYLFPDAPAPECGNPHPCQRTPWYDKSVGVVRRTVVDPVPEPDLVAEWRYVQHSPTEPPPPGHCVRAIPVTSTVVFHDAEASVYHASTFAGGYPVVGEGWDPAEFGLPVNHKQQRQLGGIGEHGEPGPLLSLSTETWGECTPVSPSNPLAPGADHPDERGCRKLEETYTRYERDVLVPDCTQAVGTGGGTFCLYSNRRPPESLTVWFDHGGSESAAQLSTNERWDGFGHYRKTTLRSSWNGRQELATGDVAGWHRRETVTNYNPGSPDVGPTTPPIPPPATSPWLLDTYDFVRETETVDLPGAAVQRARSDYCFDGLGRLAGQRTRSALVASASWESVADPPAGADDLLIRFDYGGSVSNPSDLGNLVRERWFGGDRQSLAGVAGCGEPAGLAAEYRRDHSYQHGVRRSTAIWDDAADLELLRLVENTDIDRNLGRVEASRSADGLVTTATWDPLGRLIRLAPPGDDPIEYIYLPYLGVDQSMRVTVYQGKDRNGDTDPEATKSRLFLDGLGRAYRTWTRMPYTQAWSERFTFFDGQGRVVKQSTAHQAQQPPRPAEAAYTLTDYDALGRVVRIRQPDHSFHSTHEVTAVHDGPHVETRYVSIQGSLGGGESSHCTILKRDPLGRTARTKHAVGCQGAHPDNVELDSYYDVGGRLAQTRSGAQSRLYSYDGRGFLYREELPELAGVTRLYSDFDALGNPGEERLDDDLAAPGYLRRQIFRYDRLGRLTQVRDGLRPSTGLGAGEPILEQFYATANDAGFADVPLRAGRLYQARRHNWVKVGGEEIDVTVTETYGYDDSGRLGERWTRTNLGQVFHQRATYNGLGAPVQTFFPTCFDGAACRNEQPFRGAYEQPLNLTYDAGRLAGASWRVAKNGAPPAGSPVVRSVDYHWNGMTAELETDDGVTWVQEIEYAGEPPWGLERPSRIFASGTDFSTGLIRYDGAGNIATMANGSERLAYDHASRLLEAELTGAKRACYGYDVYGNLTEIDRDATAAGCPGTGIALAVDPATNRLAGSGDAYDSAGNQIGFDGRLTLAYDVLDMPVRSLGLGVHKAYVYTPDGERLATLDELPGGQLGRRDTWTLRDLGHQLVRTMSFEGGSWSWEKDHARADGRTVATRDGTTLAPRYLHPDHLGTPRRITDENGTVVASHRYYPYGWEISDPAVDDEVVKFTGHERDANDTLGTASRLDDLDYMHARYYTPYLGRFLSVDPIGGAARSPNGWSRYAYSLGNPLTFVDSDGQQAAGTIPVWGENMSTIKAATPEIEAILGRPATNISSMGPWSPTVQAEFSAVVLEEAPVTVLLKERSGIKATSSPHVTGEASHVAQGMRNNGNSVVEMAKVVKTGVKPGLMTRALGVTRAAAVWLGRVSEVLTVVFGTADALEAGDRLREQLYHFHNGDHCSLGRENCDGPPIEPSSTETGRGKEE